MNLDTFTTAYIECALWSSTDGDTPLDEDYGLEDIAPETLEAMRQDCQDFIETAGDLLGTLDAEQAGRDFWLTRNGHGAGFWDRGLGDLGQQLTELSEPYGSFDLYLGDDGRIYGQ